MDSKALDAREVAHEPEEDLAEIIIDELDDDDGYVLSLREQKKAETEVAIREAAIKLFLDQGYERTTVEAIADMARVSQRTVFRYFASKDEILLSGAEEEVANTIELLEAQPADAPVMTAVQAVVEQMARNVQAQRSTDIRVARLLDAEPVLRARYLAVLDSIERGVVTWAAKRLGMAPSDWQPRLIAACMLAAYRVAAASDTRTEADILDVLRRAVEQLGRGFDEL